MLACHILKGAQPQTYQALLESLSRTDIEVRLSAPTRCLRFFPELEGKSAIESQAIDALGKQWSFKLSVGRGGIHHKPVITGQWP